MVRSGCFMLYSQLIHFTLPISYQHDSWQYAHLEQLQDGKDNIVTVAEARRLSLLRMVHAPCHAYRNYSSGGALSFYSVHLQWSPPMMSWCPRPSLTRPVERNVSLPCGQRSSTINRTPAVRLRGRSGCSSSVVSGMKPLTSPAHVMVYKYSRQI